MDDEKITAVRAELDDFVERVFVSLPRSDQRSKENLYLRGLMLDGRRKSMQTMGERLGIDYQQLQQFVTSSPAFEFLDQARGRHGWWNFHKQVNVIGHRH